MTARSGATAPGGGRLKTRSAQPGPPGPAAAAAAASPPPPFGRQRRRAFLALSTLTSSTVSIAGTAYSAQFDSSGWLELRTAESRGRSSSSSCSSVRHSIADREVRGAFERMIRERGGICNAALFWLGRKDASFQALQAHIEQQAHACFTPWFARSAPALLIWAVLVVFFALAAEGLADEFSPEEQRPEADAEEDGDDSPKATQEAGGP